MQTRDSLFKRLKELGVTACRRVEPYLVLGGVATNLYILTAPQHVLDTQTCEHARSRLDQNAALLAILNAVLVADTGIYVFNVTGAIRAIVIPTTHWAYNQVAELMSDAPRLSKHQLKSLEICENELIRAVSTGIFISMLPLSKAITMPLLPIAALPFVRAYLKHNLFKYPGPASLPDYRKTYPDRPRLATALAAIESISTGINLGSALSALSYFLINTFYDSAHKHDWADQNYVMYAMAALGMVAGMATIFNERTHRVGNHAANTIQTFELICLPLISMTLCFAPQLENINTFMQESIYVVLGIAAFSLLLAEIHTRLTTEQEATDEQKDVVAQETAPEMVRVEEVDAGSDKEDFITAYGTFYSKQPKQHAVNDDRSLSSSPSPSPSPQEDV